MSRNKKAYRKIREVLKGIISNMGSVILILALCTIVIAIIINWKSVVIEMQRFIKVIMPFIFGLVLAFLINPLVESVRKILDRLFFRTKYKKACKYTSVAVSYAILLGLLTVTIVYIVPQISESVKELTKSLGNGYNYIIHNTGKLQEKYPFLPMTDITELIEKVVPQNIFSYGPGMAKIIFPYIYNLSASFISGFINIIFAIVISVYIILDKEKIVKELRRFIYTFASNEKAPFIWSTFRECNHIFNGFLFGKSVDSLIIGILSLIAMSIIGLPYGLLLSVIVGVTNMIPYFGPIMGAIPGVIIYLVIEPKYAIIYVIMILILQQFDGLYLGPKILGDLTGIKPLWVIFGITVGGAYFGVLGMFLGVPVVAVIMHIISVIMETKMKKKMLKEIEVRRNNKQE